MSELPKGWTTATIGSLCKLENGRAFKPTEWSTSGMPIVRIQNLNNAESRFNYFKGEFDDRYYLKGGELLFAWSGTPGTSFGAHVWKGGEAVLNQHIFRVDFDESSFDKRFFRYAINQKLGELIDIAHGGVGLRHVTKGKFEGTEILIPPHNEQKRIADKLDSLLARVDACRERLDRIPTILKRLRQSVVTAAVTGKLADGSQSDLAREMTGYEYWNEQRVDELCENGRVITYGVIKLGGEVSDGVPCLRTSNVRWLNIETDGMKRIAVALSADYPRTILRGGEVLVNVRGTLGGVAVADKSMAGWNVSREVAVVPVDGTRVDPTFLAYSIGSTESQRWLARVEKGVAYTGINIEDLRNLPVKFPSIKEQRQIVARVQTLLASAGGLESRYTAAYAHIERLTLALLSKAFRGELAPQDPNDEPAEELLKKIQLAKKSKSLTTKEKKPGKRVSKQTAAANMLKRSEIQSNHLTKILRSQGPLTAETLWAASQLEIDDFYDQLKEEEEKGLLKERRDKGASEVRLLEVA
ncbi:MAG: restriction endonuclease subunit S [Planctomyces sp.]|nr:restriction endonuclease subunit S [Planctomyces sp.]